MKRIKKLFVITVSSALVLVALLVTLLQPVLTFGQNPPYEGEKIQNWKTPSFDASKKTVFIIADNKQTEMFDMLAPFYVFNATEQLNVCIVAKNDTPIPLKKDLYMLPQLTFEQVENMHLKADVIVIPALSIRDENQDPAVITFIKSHMEPTTRLISICDGSATAAATGLYDGKPITTHATDYDCVKKHFDKPIWTQNITVTKSGNLYSTAGVANAVDGSLLIVEELLGTDARIKAADRVNYPHADLQLDHKSIALTFGNKMSIIRRVIFNKRKKLGLLLHDGLNELKFASILDTYSRTYPKEYKTFTLQNSIVKTQYGLTFIHKGDNAINPRMDEVHVVMPELLSQQDETYFKGFDLVKQNADDYSMDQCISRIKEQYGEHYANIVKLTLDYN
ncbi:MAG TPA: DJ-1/PfpI family protein [Chitinophagaceae bacterium]|nr:DJ-1/PfpI family protein [Chitinophagaceae bacterium]